MARSTNNGAQKVRCPWATDPLLIDYHDNEWGVAVHDDRRHFEMLALEGAQAGLSWKTVLAKRDNYRNAFAGFDPQTVAAFDESDLAEMMLNAGLIRHRPKLQSVITNARAILRLYDDHASLDDYLWNFVDHRPIVHRFRALEELPAKTELSKHISTDMRKRGFAFVGPTTCYSHLQAAGLVNDHLVTCPQWRDDTPVSRRRAKDRD